MSAYRELYYRLFAAAADGVEALENQDYGKAKKILIEAQQDAEEKYLSQETEPKGANQV